MKLATLDTETLDLDRVNAVVFELGVVLADMDDTTGECTITDQLLFCPSLTEQLALARTVSQDTLRFHVNHHNGDLAAFQARLDAATQPLAEVHEKLRHHLDGVDELWINGLSFDPVVLHYLFASIGKQLPWYFRKERDVRTVRPALKLKGIVSDFDSSLPRHRALTDALWNLSEVKAYYSLILRVKL